MGSWFSDNDHFGNVEEPILLLRQRVFFQKSNNSAGVEGMDLSPQWPVQTTIVFSYYLVVSID